MKTSRRRLTKRNAPRRSNTRRKSNFLMIEKVIVHARLVNAGCRHIGEIIPAALAQIFAVSKRKASH